MSVSLACDLRTSFGGIRDQKARPTCLAFAVSDTHGATFAPFEMLSVEFLYYHAVQLTGNGDPNRGINLVGAGKALMNDGQPHEIHWPYQEVVPTPLSQWNPPNGNYPIFKRRLCTVNKNFDAICAALTSHRPVILSLQLSESFYSPQADGIVEQKLPDPATSNHAVVAVGHGRTTKERCLLIRNSWGCRWGIDGHAFLEEGYLTNRILAASTLD